jgi:hypothetical protein
MPRVAHDYSRESSDLPLLEFESEPTLEQIQKQASSDAGHDRDK